MKDVKLFTKLGLEKDFSDVPYYCGKYEKSFQASLYVEAWEQYSEGYTPSYIEIICPLLKNGRITFYANGNEFPLAVVKNILSIIKKCLEYYK